MDPRSGEAGLLWSGAGAPRFAGKWGLPGGFLEWKERTEECCARETLEETGLKVAVGACSGCIRTPIAIPADTT